MNHPSEQNIERYLLGSRELTSGEVTDIAVHLSECRECYALYHELQGFYQELQDTRSSSETEIDRFMSQLFPDSSILHLSPDHSDLHYTGPFILAAKSETESAGRFERLVSFGSGDHSTMVRVLRDHHAGKLKFYVIRDEQESEGPGGPYILYMPELNRELVTDADGKAEIPEDAEMQAQLSKGAMRLALPLAQVRLSVTGENTLKTEESDHYRVDTVEASGEIQLTITPRGQHPVPSRLLVEAESGATCLIPVSGGGVTIDEALIRRKQSRLLLFE